MSFYFQQLFTALSRSITTHCPKSQHGLCAKRHYQGNMNDIWKVEVSGDGWQTSTNEVGLIRLESMHLLAILFRVDRHSANTHLSTCSEHTNGNLTWTINAKMTLSQFSLLSFILTHKMAPKLEKCQYRQV